MPSAAARFDISGTSSQGRGELPLDILSCSPVGSRKLIPAVAARSDVHGGGTCATVT